MKKAKFIAFEGIDKAGKMVQVGLLQSYLESLDLSVSLFEFPNYQTETGLLIKSYLQGSVSLPIEAATTLYTTNKYEALPDLCASLQYTDFVLVDRYKASAVAYSSARGEVPTAWIDQLEAFLPNPDLTIYLDIDPSVSMERKGKSEINDKYESNMGFLGKVRSLYIDFVVDHPRTWLAIDGEETIAKVHLKIREAVASRFLDDY